MGDQLRKSNFQANSSKYMLRFTYEILFFTIVIVILMAVIFGLIIDTFAELREETNKTELDKKNICFICGAHKNDLEKDGINFYHHTTFDHNLWIYADYIIGLKFLDPQETNAVNSYVIEMCQNKSISWFPSSGSEEESKEGE